MEDLKEFTLEELTAEVERRTKLKNDPWPRRVEVNAEIELDNEDSILEVTGFDDGSVQHDQVFSILNCMLTLEIDNDGGTRIAAVDGNEVELSTEEKFTKALDE